MQWILAISILLLALSNYYVGKRCDILSKRIDIIRREVGLDLNEQETRGK